MIANLMEANLLAVFNERDTDKRLAAIKATYTTDIRWTDDEGVSVGHDALNTKAAALLDGPLAGLEFIKDGPVHELAGFGYLAWHVVAPGSAEPLVSGFDVALLDGDLISQLFTVITKAP